MKWFTRLFQNDNYAQAVSAVEEVVDRKLRETVSVLNSVDGLVQEKMVLESELDQLRRDSANLSSDIARERTDVSFKLGLEKLRQQQDAQIAQQQLQHQRDQIEAEKAVAIREARLAAKEEATEEARQQMRAFQDRQERMIGQLLEALPSAKIIQQNNRTTND